MEWQSRNGLENFLTGRGNLAGYKELLKVKEPKGPNNVMPFRKVREITGKSFYWARTIKVPYLSKEEAEKLVVELDKYLK